MKTNSLKSLCAFVALLGAVACSDGDDTSVKVDAVTVDPAEVEIEAGASCALTAVVTPSGVAGGKVVWSTSDAEVATVDEAGLVLGVAPGSAVVTATAGGRTASCAVTVTPPFVAPNVGDFFYSDGTWSSEADYFKTIIGVVFWTGDPSADDARLRADHPDCTHGLVIGLDQQDVIAWQPEYESAPGTVSQWVEANAPGFDLPCSGSADDDPIQRIVGYNNTKAIEAYNAAAENAGWPVEVVRWVVELRRDLPAPKNTSDWYIPSPKELSLLCAGEIEGNIYIKDPIMTRIEYINTRFAEIDQPQMTEKTYWSSMENKGEVAIQNEMAWNYYFKELKRPLSASFKSWGSEYARVRAVLAF